jgi:hypothetical protein
MDDKQKAKVKQLAIKADMKYPDIQLIIAMEELNEFSLELSRMLRYNQNPDTYTGMPMILEEMADVEIIIESLKQIFALQLVKYDYDIIVKQKINKFERQIE